MSGTVVGAVSGASLALIALAFGFWGVLLAVVFAATGALIGALATGRIDRHALGDVLRGRRSAA